MREYAVVLITAALVTFLTTPVVRMLAIRFKLVAAVRDRDVHVIPTPRGGGVAMYLGVAAAMLVAHQLPALQSTFEFNSQTTGVLLAGGLICLLGVLDDRFGIDALTKLTGQIACAGVMVLLGVQLAFVFLPFADIGTLSLGPDVGVPVTVLVTVMVVNALNFIDGLDGLAAGVSAIAALAFFAYSYNLGLTGFDQVASAPALITAVLAGACLGFLPHNFNPARIFMGDSGSMLVGLMLSAAAVSANGQADPQVFGSAANLLPLTLPLLIPVAILFIPFVDLLLAVVRRTRRGQSPFSPDKMHLHHRLLSIGHSHRRAVLIMYFWAALLSFGAVALSITGGTVEVVVVVAVLLVVGVVAVLSPRARRAARDQRLAEIEAARDRSRRAHPTSWSPPPRAVPSQPPRAVASQPPRAPGGRDEQTRALRVRPDLPPPSAPLRETAVRTAPPAATRPVPPPAGAPPHPRAAPARIVP